MLKKLIVITGKNGQLGQELEQECANYHHDYRFLFTGTEELDLNNPFMIPAFFEKHQPGFFINCAAYTAVDRAETEQEQAFRINAVSVGEIAKQCEKGNCTLIQLSTDYVFNGMGVSPYQPTEKTDPVNYYGYTKMVGEKLALQNNLQTIVIRTSWLYSAYGSNFVKTMLRLMKEKPVLKVVNDQIGSPTYARDLAETIMQMITSVEKGNHHKGIYHYSNEARITWFEFATTIRDIAGLTCQILPVSSQEYPVSAKRPSYAILDKLSLVNDFGIELKDWKKSLAECLKLLV